MPRSSPQFLPMMLRIAPWALPPSIALGVLTVLPSESTAGFYSLAAQIIPVLLLTLAVEARVARMTSLPALLSADPKARYDDEVNLPVFARAVYGAALVLYLAVAEVVALAPVVNDNAADGNAAIVMSAICGGLAAIAVLALVGWGTPLPADERSTQQAA